jgi:HlyD family secretion protein
MKFTLITLLVFLVACSSKETETKVQTDKIASHDIVEKVEGIGSIKPELEVKLTSDVSGRILEIYGKPGDNVREGQVLVRIDEKNYRAALERAESSKMSAEANLKKSKGELTRSTELRNKNLISQSELEIVQANFEIETAQLNQADASLREARENLAKCTVRSPINGTITIKNKEKGEIAQGSGFTLDVIMIVANLSKMETVVDVTENDITKVKLGQEVDLEVEAFNGKTFKGKVVEIANASKSNVTATDKATNYEVKILIVDKNELFRPGMNVTAAIKTNYAMNVVSVPIQAVTARSPEELDLKKSPEEKNTEVAKANEKNFSDVKKEIKDSKKLEEVVFVVTADKLLEKRKVEKGISNDEFYQILSGLKEGDEVVVGPFSALSTVLKNGDKVVVDNNKGKRGDKDETKQN